MYELKEQDLLAILGKHPSQRAKLIITDVDGTMASFWDYFVPAIRDFLQVISVKLDIPVSELAEDIGRVIDRRGTHEYPWLLEETSFAWKHFSKSPDKFREIFVRPFWNALDNNRTKYLRPFPQVLHTLAELKNQGVKIVGLSDAPDYMARVRNQQIFDGLLDAVYALETVEPLADDIWQPISLDHGRARVNAMHTATRNLQTKFHVLPATYEKPNPAGVDRILEDFDVYPQETIFVGDSLTKDGVVAARRGIRFVWAHYGNHLPAEYEEIVNYSLRPEGEDAIKKPLPMALVTAVAARYDELLSQI